MLKKYFIESFSFITSFINYLFQSAILVASSTTHFVNSALVIETYLEKNNFSRSKVINSFGI
jgi:hypothetical protein